MIVDSSTRSGDIHLRGTLQACDDSASRNRRTPVISDPQTPTACATCPLRPNGICGVLQAARGEPRRMRQSFGGARADETIYRRGEKTDDVFILCYGWALAVAILPDGRRQILSILMAGDLLSTNLIFRDTLGISFQALTQVRYSRIRRADIQARLASDPGTLQALAQVFLAETKAAQDMIIDLGRRTADERIARLLVSLARRVRERSVIREERYPFPLRQRDIADLVGLTPVHVSRVIGKFRRAGLIAHAGGVLTILDAAGLERVALG